jgi:hypothetical protein
MPSKKPAADEYDTLPECRECHRSLTFLSPVDVAKQLEAVLAATLVTPFPSDVDGQNRRGQENTDKLMQARIRMHHLACHLRRRCVFCSPVLPTFDVPPLKPAEESHDWVVLGKGAWTCCRCGVVTRDDDPQQAPPCAGAKAR